MLKPVYTILCVADVPCTLKFGEAAYGLPTLCTLMAPVAS
jgi:hypothetical protein